MVRPFVALSFQHPIIDGTVEGNPADLTKAPYKDTVLAHDRTFYGKGCKNSWGTGGDGGSITPCNDSDAGGRFVKTADNETQKNGTYYDFQAVTVGNGSTITTDNTNSPDTFCPLGWQLPYSGTGGDYYDKSRSWRYLFNKYGFVDSIAGSNNAKSYPLSYVYSGDFNWGTGRLYYQSNGGIFWPSTSYSSATAYNLGIWSNALRFTEKYGKLDGLPLRCDFDISILEKLSMASAFTHQYYGFSFFKSAFPLCQNYE